MDFAASRSAPPDWCPQKTIRSKVMETVQEPQHETKLDDELAVMIKCPSTGKPVKTGMSMNKYSFQKALIGAHEVRCPHCGQIHVWSKKDTHLAGELP